ncbi:MAG: DsbA family protein, partial [Caulobacter sp.]
TFEVNGKRLGGEEGGEQTLAQLDAAIAEASK